MGIGFPLCFQTANATTAATVLSQLNISLNVRPVKMICGSYHLQAVNKFLTGIKLIFVNVR